MFRESSSSLGAQVTEVPNGDMKTVASGAPVALFGKIFGKGIYVVSQVLLARLLGPQLFGLYAIGLTMFNLIGGLIPMGLQNGVIHFAMPLKDTRSEFKGVVLRCIGLCSFSGLVWGSLFFLIAPTLAVNFFHKPELEPVFRWFALALPVAGVLQIASAATRISKRMKYTVYTEDAGQPALELLLMVSFFLIGWGIAGIVSATFFSSALALALALYFIGKLFAPAMSAKAMQTVSYGQILRFSFPAALALIFNTYIIWVGRLQVGYFRSTAEAGIYQAASQAPILFSVILSGISAIAVPMFADLRQSQDRARLEALFRITTKWSLYLSLPLVLVMCFAPETIMRLIFGPAYVLGASALVILTLSQLVNAGTGPVGSLLVMTGRSHEWAAISGLGLLLELIVGIILVPSMGMNGAAIAVSAATIFVFLSGILRAKWALGIWPYDARFRKVLISGAAAAIILALARFSGFLSSAGGLVAASVLSIGVYALLIYAQGLDEEDKELINTLMARIGFQGIRV